MKKAACYHTERLFVNKNNNYAKIRIRYQNTFSGIACTKFGNLRGKNSTARLKNLLLDSWLKGESEVIENQIFILMYKCIECHVCAT
jgi:hypothetical protein